jgi:hypothetical protein
MEQYINKDVVVAEIEKAIKIIYAGREYVGIPYGEECIVSGLQKAEDIINTIEVKEEVTTIDTFIKKACDFFEENIEEEDCKIGSSEWTELRAEYKSLDSFIRAFVEYMKGE